MENITDQKSVFFGMTKDAYNGVPWERLNDPKPGQGGMSDLVPTRGGWADAQHKNDVREGAVDTASLLEAQAGRIASAATAAAGVPGPHAPFSQAHMLNLRPFGKSTWRKAKETYEKKTSGESID